MKSRTKFRGMACYRLGDSPGVVKLETSEDYKRAAQALKKEAKKRELESLTPEERAELIVERQRKAQRRAQAKKEAQERRVAPQEKSSLLEVEKEFKPRVYNVWNFSKCDDRFGMKGYPGRIPGQIVQNLLYYYTEENDLVVDPMAGSGTTGDVCKLMNRKCLSYDIAPVRDDIIQHDIRLGFPPEAKDCQLIFLDPPYWRLQREGYDKLSSGQSTSASSYEEWLEFMRKLAEDCFKTVKRGGYVALLIEAFLDERITGKFLDLPFKCLRFFEEAGFIEIQRISAPMPSEIKSAQDVEYAKSKRIMLDLNRDLIVLRKHYEAEPDRRNHG